MNLDQGTTIELSLPSELGAERLVRQLVAWVAERLSFASDRIADLQTAISEACINAIEHGNQALNRLKIGVTLTVTPTYLEAVVSDEGIAPFQPRWSTCPTIEDKLAGLAPARGMGLMLIQALVDECGFVTDQPARGNHFRLRLYRPQSATSAAAA